MLNEIENEKLISDCKKANISYGEYFRKLLMEKQIKEKPGKEFYEVMKQLSKIGVNLNQIAYKANSTNKIDKDYYKTEAEKWHKFAKEVKQKFLQEVVSLATTSLWKVVKRMDHVINYAEEKSKTKNIELKSNYEIISDDLRDVINYAKNSNKTEKEYFVTGINCEPDSVYEEMQDTKRYYNKGDKILVFPRQSIMEWSLKI